MHLGSIFRPEVLCPFDIAHIETAISPPSYLLVWCIIHFHHFKYHDPYNDLHMLTLCIHPWQLGGCGYHLSALLWSSIFVTLMANKIGGLQFGIYRNCQISSRVFHTAVAALPLTKANRSDFE